MNQYVDWQSLKRTKVEEIVPGDLAWWFMHKDPELVVVLGIDYLFYSALSKPVTVLYRQTIITNHCSSLIKVVDNPNLLQVT